MYFARLSIWTLTSQRTLLFCTVISTIKLHTQVPVEQLLHFRLFDAFDQLKQFPPQGFYSLPEVHYAFKMVLVSHGFSDYEFPKKILNHPKISCLITVNGSIVIQPNGQVACEHSFSRIKPYTYFGTDTLSGWWTP